MHKIPLISEVNWPAPKVIFTDIDGTLTEAGRISDKVYSALWSLFRSGIKVIPVTGRPAGWCDMIARTWPVEGVIGENGGLFFSYVENKPIKQLYAQNEELRQSNQQKLNQVFKDLKNELPQLQLASDQFARTFDLAIDICEDTKPLDVDQVQKIQKAFRSQGATSKLSNIHINNWFGDHDKLTMCKTVCKEHFKMDFDELKKESVFLGDSPNDEPMFQAFEYSVGVANLKPYLEQLTSYPSAITMMPEGEGFIEYVHSLEVAE